MAHATKTRAALLGELDLAIGAHIHWLIEHNVKPKRFALTAPEVVRLLENCEMDKDARKAKKATAVLSSLQRLLAFKNRIKGPATVATEIEAELSSLATTVSPERRRQVRKAAQASTVAHDDGHLVALESRMSQFESRARTLLKGLDTYEQALGVRRERFRRANVVGVDKYADEVARARWVKYAVQEVVFECRWFHWATRGASTLVFPEEATQATWRSLRDECIANEKKADITSATIADLFPFPDAREDEDPEGKRLRGQKRASRAVTRRKTKR